MTTYELQETREYQALKQLEDSLNSTSWDPKLFAQSIPMMHRTLQQSLFRTFIASIQYMARDNYGTDPRNEAAHETAKKIIESGALNDCCLPFI